MQPPPPSTCAFCGKNLPSGNQYRYCNYCGQPRLPVTGLPGHISDQPESVLGPLSESQPSRKISPFVFFFSGLLILVVISLVYIFFVRSTNQPIDNGATVAADSLIKMEITGVVVQAGSIPPHVEYLIVNLENSVTGSPVAISGNELNILYSDFNTSQLVFYPGDAVGVLSLENTPQGIQACSQLAQRQEYKAIWCTTDNDNLLSPGEAIDVYVFLGGLINKLQANSDFNLDFLGNNWEQRVSGKTPIGLVAPAPNSTVSPIPTVTSIPVPTEEPTLIPEPVFTFPTPVIPQETPTVEPPDPNQDPADTIEPTACESAEDGTLVTAWVNGTMASATTVQSGKYNLMVEASAGGQIITFEIDGVPAQQTLDWVSGGATELNLTTGSDSLDRFQSAPGEQESEDSTERFPPHVVLGTVSVGNC